MNKKTKEFLEFYRQLCEEYGLYIDIAYGEVPSDLGLMIEEVVCPSEIENHIKELEEGG